MSGGGGEVVAEGLEVVKENEVKEIDDEENREVALITNHQPNYGHPQPQVCSAENRDASPDISRLPDHSSSKIISGRKSSSDTVREFD